MIDYESRRGRLAADPELRFTPSGKAVTSFCILQSNSKFNEQSQKWENTATNPVNVVVWNETRRDGSAGTPWAELAANNLVKGNKVTVHGQFRQRSWQDKQGVTQYRTEFQADEVSLALDAIEAGETPPGGGQSTGGQSQGNTWGTPAQSGQSGQAPPF